MPKLGVEKAREMVANLLECESKEIIFTSGSTEAINHILRAMCARQFRHSRGRRNHVITTNIEHPAVINTCKFLEVHGYQVTWLECDKYGMIHPQMVERALTPKVGVISNCIFFRFVYPCTKKVVFFTLFCCILFFVCLFWYGVSCYSHKDNYGINNA